MNSLFGELAQDLAKIAKNQFKKDRKGLAVFKRLFKNLTKLFEALDFDSISFKTFEGLFDKNIVYKIETDLTALEGYSRNVIFQELLVSLYPIIRLYYALRLYEQKMLLSKFYIKNGIEKQSEFEQLKVEAEELKSKTALDLVITFVKQSNHHKAWRKLVPHYEDIAMRYNCYHRNSGKINFSEVARKIRNIVGVSKVSYTTVLQALDRYKK